MQLDDFIKVNARYLIQIKTYRNKLIVLVWHLKGFQEKKIARLRSVIELTLWHWYLAFSNTKTTASVGCCQTWCIADRHDGIMAWKHFPHYWPFMSGIGGFLSPKACKVQFFPLLLVWTSCWTNIQVVIGLRHLSSYVTSLLYFLYCWILVLQCSSKNMDIV